MSDPFGDVLFAPVGNAPQERGVTHAQYLHRQRGREAQFALGAHETRLLEQVDSFYLTTVSDNGWPDVQHRCGPRGFLRVISPTRIGFADYRNMRDVSTGSAPRNHFASVIVMDYAHCRRLKVLGHLAFVDGIDRTLLQHVALPGYLGENERIATIDVLAFDWNRPLRRTHGLLDFLSRETRSDVHERIAQLEAELRGAHPDLRSDSVLPQAFACCPVNG